ncbi:MAG: glycosyltransferase family 1 protein [Proteobacteria bacterium]|nr:glycosyltransferase family 1 protein [Pseudomonadota bacterium]NBP13327.1 glycosyltransferase family 1 protein [bacterium]
MFITGNFTPPLLQTVPSVVPVQQVPANTPLVADNSPPPDVNLPRAVQYYADYSGCGFWRMLWPEHLLNAYGRMTVHGSTVMVLDPRWYVNVKVVRVQRQATSSQLQFVKFLREVSEQISKQPGQTGFRIVYEIDDLVFCEDIPDYNKFKTAFVDPQIRKNAQDIMSLCDEITVTNDFMKDYYKEKTGHKHVTVIPNYPPKFWLGHFYNEKQISSNYDTYKAKPRILYAGSGAHFDVENRVNQRDDFEHIIRTIYDTHTEFQWVFLGAFPLPLRPLVERGLVEFHPWTNLYNYGETIYKLRINMMIAPLQDNNFNKSKSDLKWIEANCFGLPIACQDLCTYKDAEFKFKTGEEMIGIVRDVLSRKGRYMNICAAARKNADSRWMENSSNLDCYYELFNYPFGAPERVNINRINGITV